MARGESGRIVLEIDPSHKDNLYFALTKDGLTLKSWFLQQTSQYLKDRSQLSLFGASTIAEEPSPYRAKPEAAIVPSLKKRQNRRKPKAK